MNDSSNRKKKVGLPPGSIIYTGEDSNHKISIEVFSYNDSIIKKRIIVKMMTLVLIKISEELPG